MAGGLSGHSEGPGVVAWFITCLLVALVALVSGLLAGVAITGGYHAKICSRCPTGLAALEHGRVRDDNRRKNPGLWPRGRTKEKGLNHEAYLVYSDVPGPGVDDYWLRAEQ